MPPGTPAFGRDWKVAVKQNYDRVMSIGFQGESPAYQTHYLDLDPTYRDNYGNPLLRITFDWEAERAQDGGLRRARSWIIGDHPHGRRPAADDIVVGGPGSLPAHYDSSPYQSTHNTGGAIMGADPATSVVNSYLQMWDAPNVFVVGACNFPQNAGFNPTGTVGALSYRAAEGILKYHKTGSGARMTARPRAVRGPVGRRARCGGGGGRGRRGDAPRPPGRAGGRRRLPRRRATVRLLPDQRLALVAAAAGVLAGPAAAETPRVGPGPDATAVAAHGYRVELRVTPNAGGRRENVFTVRTTRAGEPVAAAVSIRFAMPAMGMPDLGLRLRPTRTGIATGTGATLTMPGSWEVVLHVAPRGEVPFDVLLVDTVGI